MLSVPNNRLPLSRVLGVFLVVEQGNNGQGKPNGGDDEKDMSQYPKVESVQETESRLDDIDKFISRMEESSDSEEE